ncbi:hypothetical protein HRbin38_00448 [bacterium HR38]|nr:hypothetical protein HRbin38_00448 [bacterium HR38]
MHGEPLSLHLHPGGRHRPLPCPEAHGKLAVGMGHILGVQRIMGEVQGHRPRRRGGGYRGLDHDHGVLTPKAIVHTPCRLRVHHGRAEGGIVAHVPGPLAVDEELVLVLPWIQVHGYRPGPVLLLHGGFPPAVEGAPEAYRAHLEARRRCVAEGHRDRQGQAKPYPHRQDSSHIASFAYPHRSASIILPPPRRATHYLA